MSQRDSEPSPPPSADRVIAVGRATLRNVDFRKARFDQFSLTGSLFLSCDFRGVRLDARYQPLFSAEPRSYFRDCHFDGADLRRVRPEHTRFERCTFDDANLDGWRTERAEFVECRFAGPIGTVVFYGRAPNEARGGARMLNDFRGNDFSDAEIDGVTFTRGVDLELQRLPEIDETLVRVDRFPQRVARATRQLTRWDEQSERIAGLEMLKALNARYRDQRDIIAQRVSRDGPAPRVQIRVWALLERVL